MTAPTVWWIVIVFFVVSSTCSSLPLEGSENSVCYRNVSRTTYRVKPTSKLLDKVLSFFGSLSNKNESLTSWEIEQVCCPHYEKKTGICECNQYWGGESCDKPLFCTITPVNVSAAGSVEDATASPLVEWKELPKCHEECLHQTNSSKFNITRSGMITYFFSPIDFSCGMIAVFSEETNIISWKTYSYILIGGGTGIIIVVLMILSIVYIVKRKGRTMEPIDLKPLEHEYDYLDFKQIQSNRYVLAGSTQWP